LSSLLILASFVKDRLNVGVGIESHKINQFHHALDKCPRRCVAASVKEDLEIPPLFSRGNINPIDLFVMLEKSVEQSGHVINAQRIKLKEWNSVSP
jgi:hypothetical protein